MARCLGVRSRGCRIDVSIPKLGDNPQSLKRLWLEVTGNPALYFLFRLYFKGTGESHSLSRWIFPRNPIKVEVSLECSATHTLTWRVNFSHDRINWNLCRRKRWNSFSFFFFAWYYFLNINVRFPMNPTRYCNSHSWKFYVGISHHILVFL